jgi:hypothetical protein
VAREVIRVLRKEQGKHLITYVLLDDGTEASINTTVYGEVKVGDKMMVYFNKDRYINARHIKEGKGDGSKGFKKES